MQLAKLPVRALMTCSTNLHIRWLLAAGLSLAVMACSSGDDDGGGRGSSSGQGAPLKCASLGINACHCLDGMPRGQQMCLEDGTLTDCVCPYVDPAETGTGGTDVVDPGPTTGAAVCADLMGLGGCSAESYKSDELPANILFLVDRSGSMLCNPPPTQTTMSCDMLAEPEDPAQASKWEITTDALKTVIADLETQGSTASVGLVFFSTDDYCGVNSEPTVGVNPISGPQVGALSAALDAIRPAGQTPIVGGTILSYAYLHQEANDAPGCTEPCGAHGNRFVVLITDGEDSCPEPPREEDAAACGDSCTDYLIDTEAPKALEANIRTFVIGAPGSENAAGFLSDLAFEGGTARADGCSHDRGAASGDCHFDMTATADFAGDLAAALQEISGAALGCEFAVPEPEGSLDPSLVNVQYTGGEGADPICFRQDAATACDSANGWQFAKNPDGSDDLTKVVLCGAACDAVRNDSEAQVDVILGCDVLLE